MFISISLAVPRSIIFADTHCLAMISSIILSVFPAHMPSISAQQTELFNESIRYNITYGTGNVTEEQIEEAARKAYAHEFISSLPEGYDTPVGQNGQKLSGGQRQHHSHPR